MSITSVCLERNAISPVMFKCAAFTVCYVYKAKMKLDIFPQWVTFNLVFVIFF